MPQSNWPGVRSGSAHTTSDLPVAMAYYAETDTPVTKKQLANLWRLVYRYRRQIEDEALIKEAEERSKTNGSNANLDR